MSQLSPEYLAYMRSSAWLRKRQMKMESVGFRCEWCRRQNGLQVHHLHYRTLGHERMEDLQVLCVRCHRDHHFLGYLPEENRNFFENFDPPEAQTERLRRGASS